MTKQKCVGSVAAEWKLQS